MAGLGATCLSTWPRLLPPCANFRDLRTLDQLDNMSSEYDDISDAAGIKRVTLKLAVFKAAAKQLHVSWTVAVRELAKANEGRQKALEQSEMDKKRKIDGDKTGLGKKPKKRARPHTALEVIQNLGKDIKTTAVEHWESAAAAWIQSSAEIEVAEPYIVTAVSWVKALVEDEDSQVAKSLREFVEEFKASEVRTKAGRCMRRSLDEASSDASANDFLLSKLYSVNPKGRVCSPAVLSGTEMVDFKTGMALSNFGVKKSSAHTYIEKHSLWSGRLSVWGTRAVAIARAMDITTYMREAGIIGMEVKQFFRDLREEGVRKLLDRGVSLWHGTVGPHEYLWIPSHCLVMESVMGSEDCVVLRCSMVLPRDKAGVESFRSWAELPTTPADHASRHVMAVARAALEAVS